MNQRTTVRDLIIANEFCVIPLKIRAWLDMTHRKESGEGNLTKEINKHKNDIYRLAQLLTDSPLEYVPESIKDDVKKFIAFVSFKEEHSIIKNLDLNFRELGQIGELLAVVYGISEVGTSSF